MSQKSSLPQAAKSVSLALTPDRYRLAADQGNAGAQYNLGVAYDNGQGVTQDYKDAVKWYRLAADQGYALAQFNLGVAYANGQGVTRDYKEAEKWYRLCMKSTFKNRD